jgi:hypothetical protein
VLAELVPLSKTENSYTTTQTDLRPDKNQGGDQFLGIYNCLIWDKIKSSDTQSFI